MLAHRHFRAALIPVVALAAAGAAARPAHRAPLRGMSYTLHLTTTPRAGGGLPEGAGNQDWTGKVVTANGRGRMDITAGAAPGMWGAGDYLLFDSSEFVIVHPASRQFLTVPADLATRSFDEMKAHGVDVSISGVTASMEPVAGSDTVDGRPTRHYKLLVTYALAMSLGVMQQSVQTQVTSDLWLVHAPDLPPNPFVRMTSSLGKGLLAPITDKVDSLIRPLAGSVPLRSVTVTQLTGAMPVGVETETRTEVSNLAPAAVDDSLLMLPQGFTAGTLPGLSAPAGDSTGAKWRRPPGGSGR